MKWSLTWLAVLVVTASAWQGRGIRIEDPYAGGRGLWYRGQVHAHSTSHRYFVHVDSLRDKVERYRDAGYDFVCMTDHNHVVRLPQAPVFPLPTRDPGVEGIHFISGAEIGFLLRPWDNRTVRQHHIGAVGMDYSVSKGDSLFLLSGEDSSTAQAAIDSIRTREYAPGKSALAVLNHPEMETRGDTRFYPQNIRGVREQAGIEVYNTLWARSKPKSKSWQSHGASHWDYLIAKGSGMRWGFATDDAHDYLFGEDFLGGWIMVQAETLSTEAILDAVKAGCFVACVDSCAGAVRDTASASFTELGVRDGRIVAASDRPSEFTWWTDDGHLTRQHQGTAADTFTVEGWERAVRVRVRNERGAAYSQPFFVENPKRDADRWKLRREKETLRLLHFDEGTGPILEDFVDHRFDLRIRRGSIPPIGEWTTLADTIAWRDSLWGGWMHNGFGTTPDEVDVDRDRSGYAFRAHGYDFFAEADPASSKKHRIDLVGLRDWTIELIGVIHARVSEPQPILVSETHTERGRAGWRLEVAPEGNEHDYVFTILVEDGERKISFGRALEGEAHLVALVVEETGAGVRARAFVGGEPVAQQTWPRSRVARTRGAPNPNAPFSIFRDPLAAEVSPPVFYAMRELRITKGARSAEALRQDAERLLLTNPALTAR